MVLRRMAPLTEHSRPLELAELPDPVPQAREILLRVSVCGVCHTELDEIEGRTPPRVPVVLGHQVVGTVFASGPGARRFRIGERVGVAWVHSACGSCAHCRAGEENLCADLRATGRDANGGYAEYLTVPEDFACRIPEVVSDVEAAPLLGAGAVGYRSLRLAGLQDGQRLGLTGFGASAHLVLMMVRRRYPAARVYVFARAEAERGFARELGAAWTGDTETASPESLDCIIDTAPAWKPVVDAIENLRPGGRLVVNAIRKENSDKEYLRRLDYSTHLWMEKEIKSVANVTRVDVREFLDLAAAIPVKPRVQEYALEQANAALLDLRQRQVRGAKVLRIG